jgi:hypothetical protein
MRIPLYAGFSFVVSSVINKPNKLPSHKPLKSVSHNFSHSFISLMNYINDDYFLGHLLKQARATKLSNLQIDVLKNKASPDPLLTKEVSLSTEYWNKWFPRLVESSGSSMAFVKSATMTIELDLNTIRPYSSNNDLTESPFSCEMSIIDDRGKEYKYRHVGWWYPEK